MPLAHRHVLGRRDPHEPAARLPHGLPPRLIRERNIVGFPESCGSWPSRSAHSVCVSAALRSQRMASRTLYTPVRICRARSYSLRPRSSSRHVFRPRHAKNTPAIAVPATIQALLAARLDLRFDATQAIVQRLAQGARADLLVLTTEALKNLNVMQVRALGSSGVGVAVRAGARKPDIGSVEALKGALLEAHSVAHSKVGASGIYFVQLLERLGIAGRVKTRVIEKGPVGLAVAAGEAQIGVQQLCELAPVAGIDIVGPLPDPVQKLTHFSAGIPAGAANPDGALRLIELLTSEAARAAMLEGGIQPTAAGS